MTHGAFTRVAEIETSLSRTSTRYYPLPFERKEYQDRLTRCREEMTKHGIDLLYVTAPEGQCYLHGYEVTWYQAASTRHWIPATATAVHVDHDRLIFIGGEDAVPSAAEDRRAIGSSTFGADDEVFMTVAKLLEDEGWLGTGTVVGLEHWSYLPPRAVSDRLEAAFASRGAQVIDGSDVMRRIRQTKSSAEIAALEHAARIGDIGLAAVAENFRPGMTHAEVYAEAMYAMAQVGGEVPGIAQAVQPGWPQSTHLLPSRRQISEGEPFAVDVAGVYKRYHANIDRTLIWGEPSAELARMNEAAKQALEVLGETAKAGTPLTVVNQALRAHYIETDVWQFHDYCGGYELGIAFPPDWVGEFEWSVADENPRGQIEANLVTNYENTFRNEDPVYPFAQIAFSRDTLVYSNTGARRLSAIPVELIVLGE
ncbi:MAG: Xaa-Pro peptidase family protein [Gammaproteobacteria bacterium]|nr:Xaa-Pro peptidase family protein [Gammaproteobacteria bacterium]